jgi:hypothetical protein
MRRLLWILLGGAVAVAAACQPIAPRVIATPVSGVAATVAPVNVPISYIPLNNFTTPVCRIYVEFKVNGDELVVVPEGNLLVNSPIAGPDGGPSGTCFIGNAHLPADGNLYHKGVEIDCGPTPIPAGQHLGDLRISTFEDTDAGTYPVDLLNPVSYRCSDGTPTSAGTRVTDADITIL